MDLYEHTNYKTIIKNRVQELKKTKPAVSLRNIASKIPIQYTYLSKALNEEKAHLNEDHIFTIGQILDFVPEEIDYLLLCRAHDLSTDTSRKKLLFSRIEKLRREKQMNVPVVEPSTANLLREMSYLFDPLCMVVHLALEVPSIRKNPLTLCSHLGISANHVKEILRKIARCNYIELDESNFTVTKIINAKMHFGREHVLTRTHQNILKTAIGAQLTKTAEENKHSYLATFNGDERCYELIKDEFQTFMKKVEKIVSTSKFEKVYQISFDFFPWV